MTDRTNQSGTSQRQKQLRGHIVWWSAIEVGCTLVLALVSTPFVAILIGPEQLGKAAIVYSVVGVIEAVCYFGIQGAVIRAPAIHTRFTDSVHTAAFAASFAGMGILIIGATPTAHLFGDNQVYALFVIASLGLPLSGYTVVMSALLARKLRVKTLAICSIASKTATFIITLTLAGLGQGAFSIVAGCIAGTVASLIVLLTACRRPMFRLDWVEVKSIIRHAVEIGLETLLSTNMIRVFSILVGYIHGMTVLGFFQVGQRIADEAATLFQSLVLRYGVAYFASYSGGRKDARDALIRSSKLLAYALIPVFVGLALCADDLVMTIFGPHWGPAAPILRYCALGWAIAFPMQMLFAATRAAGYQPLLTFQALVSAVLSLAVLLAIQRYGAWSVGVAWAARQLSVLPFALIAVSLVFAGARLKFIEGLARPALASLMMVASVLFATADLGLGPIYRLGVQTAVGIFAYVIAVWSIDPRFVNTMRAEAAQLVSSGKLKFAKLS